MCARRLRADRPRDGSRRRDDPQRAGGRREDGRRQEARRRSEDPISQGGLCARGQAAIQVTYHPDRLTQPMKRTGARGAGEFKEIPWDEAIAELVAQLDALAAAGDQKSLACLTRPRRSRRLALAAEFLSRFGAPPPIAFEIFGDDVLRRANAIELRPRAAADDRPRAIAIRPVVRRRFPRHVELAGGAERGVRPDAAGPVRQRARQVRAGRIADVADRRERRRVGAGQAGTEGVLALGLAHVILAQQAAARPMAADAQARRSTDGRAAWPSTRPRASNS